MSLHRIETFYIKNFISSEMYVSELEVQFSSRALAWRREWIIVLVHGNPREHEEKA